MTTVRDLIRAARVAAIWLLLMSMFGGPAGLGAWSTVAGGLETCEVSCPCDETADLLPSGARAAHVASELSAEADRQGDGAPCPDDCPEDCPDCGCCFGVALAVIPLTLSSTTSASSKPLGVLSPVYAPAKLARTGVFRPPRSLS